MITIEQAIQAIYKLEIGSLEKLRTISSIETFSKGKILMRADRVEGDLYIILDGLVRAYTLVNDNEFTFWFGRAGDPVLSMRSYIYGLKGYEDIEVLEESTFIRIPHSHLQQLYAQDIEIANWGRRLAEIELVKAEELFISRQFKTAGERYKELLDVSPDLIQRVPLGIIASFLGITQVSLSRIRAELK